MSMNFERELSNTIYKSVLRIRERIIVLTRPPETSGLVGFVKTPMPNVNRHIS